MICADCLIPRKLCWEQMHTDVSPFQLVSLYQPGRLLYSLGEDWLFLATGQVTQEWLTGAGEPAGRQTLSSVMAKVLSAAQLCRKPACTHVLQCGSLMAQTCWRERSLKNMQQQILSELATQGALPALVSAQRGQHCASLLALFLRLFFLFCFVCHSRQCHSPHIHHNQWETAPAQLLWAAPWLGHGDEECCSLQPLSQHSGGQFITLASATRDTQHCPSMKWIKWPRPYYIMTQPNMFTVAGI